MKGKSKELQKFSARLQARLRQAGYRLTPQRALILDTIARSPGHPSAGEIYRRSRNRLPGLNLVTVYRTLQTLHGAGLVDMLSAGTATVRFSLRDMDHRHQHLVCRRCQRELELRSDLVERLARQVRREHGFRMEVDHLTLCGLCRDCARPQAGEGARKAAA
jgi:Fur family ferric uptake transcriptional regulator